MTVLSAQLGRTAGVYRQGGYFDGNVGTYRAPLDLYDAPAGWMWLSVQLQYDKIEVPGIVVRDSSNRVVCDGDESERLYSIRYVGAFSQFFFVCFCRFLFVHFVMSRIFSARTHHRR